MKKGLEELPLRARILIRIIVGLVVGFVLLYVFCLRIRQAIIHRLGIFLVFFGESFVRTQPLDEKDVEDLKISYGVTMAVALGSLLAILGSGVEPSDFSLNAAITSFAVAIPFLVVSFYFAVSLKLRTTILKYPNILSYLQRIGSLATLIGFIFIFFHFSKLAGILFLVVIFLSGVIVITALLFSLIGDEELSESLLEKVPVEKRENVRKSLGQLKEMAPRLKTAFDKLKQTLGQESSKQGDK